MSSIPEAVPASRRRLSRGTVGYAIGFAVILVAAGLFALIAAHATPTSALGHADQAIADAILLRLPRAVFDMFGVLTHLGDPAFLALVGMLVAALLWRQGRRVLTLGWVLALTGNALLNPLLKGIFERTRPVREPGLALEIGFSFPSGHSSGAMVVYGMLVYLALKLLQPRWHALTIAAGVALVLTVGSSRAFLRVHFASDVAAGLLSGLAWLTVCILSIEYATRRRLRTNDSQEIE